jgi:general secretion pathway protein A
MAHRLSIAGSHTRIEFEEGAVARLFELSGGSPRTVSLLCDRAMTRGHAAFADIIATEFIQSAAVDLDLQSRPADRPVVLKTVLLAAAFVLLMLAGAAGALWVSRDSVNRVILEWGQAPLPPGRPVRSLPAPIAPIPPPSVVPDDAKPPSGTPR